MTLPAAYLPALRARLDALYGARPAAGAALHAEGLTLRSHSGTGTLSGNTFLRSAVEALQGEAPR